MSEQREIGAGEWVGDHRDGCQGGPCLPANSAEIECVQCGAPFTWRAHRPVLSESPEQVGNQVERNSHCCTGVTERGRLKTVRCACGWKFTSARYEPEELVGFYQIHKAAEGTEPKDEPAGMGFEDEYHAWYMANRPRLKKLCDAQTIDPPFKDEYIFGREAYRAALASVAPAPKKLTCKHCCKPIVKWCGNYRHADGTFFCAPNHPEYAEPAPTGEPEDAGNREAADRGVRMLFHSRAEWHQHIDDLFDIAADGENIPEVALRYGWRGKVGPEELAWARANLAAPDVVKTPGPKAAPAEQGELPKRPWREGIYNGMMPFAPTLDKFTDTLLSHLQAANERAERAERELAEARAGCVAWEDAVGGLEAHIEDRIAMSDPANPKTYLQILKADVANVRRDTEAIRKATWHRESLYLQRAERAEKELAEVKNQHGALLNAVEAFMAEEVTIHASTRRQIDYALALVKGGLSQ